MSNVSDEALEDLQVYLARAEFPKGFPIVSPNEITHTAYFILKGHVKYVIESPTDSGEVPSEEGVGVEVPLDNDTPGTVVGTRGVGQTIAAVSALSGVHLLSSVIAAQDTTALVLPKEGNFLIHI